MKPLELVLVTGLSGSGKTTAGKALQDLGYFCVNNLPAPLLLSFVELMEREPVAIDRAAVVMDSRPGAFVERAPAILDELFSGRTRPSLLFLECDDDVVVRRYAETRRNHPLDEGSVRRGVERERALLAELRGRADVVVETSSFTVHDLRHFVHKQYGSGVRVPLRVHLESFGFRWGSPSDADLVFDVRFLPNPHYDPALRPRDGRDPVVRDHVFANGEADEMVRRTGELLEYLLPRFRDEGKTRLTVGIGCTGGKHRSVAVTEALRARLGAHEGVLVDVRHRDVDRGG